MSLPDTFELLEQLSAASGVSGHEAQIRDLLRERFDQGGLVAREDAMGSLSAWRPADRDGSAEADARPSVMLACHMDEIGLMVTRVEAGGFLRIAAMGGWDRRILLAQPVTVHGRRDLPGVIGSRPPHVLPADQRGKAMPWDELFIDVGLPENELRDLVRVGDVISQRRPLTRLGGSLASGKALDNRASLCTMLLCMEMLSDRRLAWDLLMAATVQEEIGLKGAKTLAFSAQPTIAIAVDVTFASQHRAASVGAKLGDGPQIAMGPNIHPAIGARLIETAKALEMKHGLEPLSGNSGTDAWAIQVARSGVPTALVSIPIRYMHSSVETLSLKDLERSASLLAEFIAGLEPDFAEQLVEAQPAPGGGEAE